MAEAQTQPTSREDSVRSRSGRRSLPTLVVRSGARTAGRFARATRIDDAVEVVAEETIVRAVESEAVERALRRVLAGPLVEDAVENALSSPAIERALANALDSEMVDHLWVQLLNSDEVQQLFERIGEAPELRAAIAAQGAGLAEDVGQGARRLARRLDDRVERALRHVLSRPRRREASSHAGLVTRALALILDGAIVNLGFLVLSGLVAFLASTLFDVGGGASSAVLIAGTGVWVAVGALYLVSFWALAGQTPGMRFLGIRLESGGERRIGVRRAIRRLFGLALAVIPLGLGLLGVATTSDRRGWQDRIADTDVLYATD